MTRFAAPPVGQGTGLRAVVDQRTGTTLARRTSISTRQRIQRERVDRWGALFLLCIAGQWIVCVIPMMVLDDTVGLPFDHDIPGAAVVRWLAFVPALIYLTAALLSFSLPRQPLHAATTSRLGKVRTPTMGRLPLFVLGFIGTLSTLGQAAFLMPLDAPDHLTHPALAGYIVLFAWALVALRVVLGLLRLLPRSWRVYTEEAPPPAEIELPDQRFAPKDGRR